MGVGKAKSKHSDDTMALKRKRRLKNYVPDPVLDLNAKQNNQNDDIDPLFHNRHGSQYWNQRNSKPQAAPDLKDAPH